MTWSSSMEAAVEPLARASSWLLWLHSIARHPGRWLTATRRDTCTTLARGLRIRRTMKPVAPQPLQYRKDRLGSQTRPPYAHRGLTGAINPQPTRLMVTMLEYSRVLISSVGMTRLNCWSNDSIQSPVELGEGDGNHQVGDKRRGEHRPRTSGNAMGAFEDAP